MCQILSFQGNKYLAQKKYDDAIRCYTEGIEKDATNSILFANRAQAYLHLKQ